MAALEMDALYPEKSGDEREQDRHHVMTFDALYPEKCGDERGNCTPSPTVHDALYPEKCGDERRKSLGTMNTAAESLRGIFLPASSL